MLRPDMEIPLHLHLAPRRHPVRLRGRRQQQRQLKSREYLGRPLPGGHVDPHPGPDPAPVIGTPLRIGDIQELLPGEEAALGELHPGLDPALVLRRPHPGGVHSQAAGLRVLQPLPVPPRLQPVRAVHHRLEVIGDDHLEYAAEERPRRLAARRSPPPYVWRDVKKDYSKYRENTAVNTSAWPTSGTGPHSRR